MSAFRLSLILMTFLSIGCGTDTGNPGTKANYGTEPNPTFALQIATKTCEKLVSCHSGINPTSCLREIFKLKNLDEEFGLAPGEYEDFAAVNGAELKGDLKVDSSLAGICTLTVGQLACEDERVRRAYQPKLVSPFDRVEDIYSGSCALVYKH